MASPEGGVTENLIIIFYVTNALCLYTILLLIVDSLLYDGCPGRSMRRDDKMWITICKYFIWIFGFLVLCTQLLSQSPTVDCSLVMKFDGFFYVLHNYFKYQFLYFKVKSTVGKGQKQN